MKAANAAGVDLPREELRKQRRWCHVIEPFEIPKQWKIYRSFDWGYNKPFSVGWWAVDFDGTVYRILEMYGCTETPNTGVKWIPPKVFEEVARAEREHPWLKGRRIGGIADPAIWNAETGVSIAETAARAGVYFEKGDHQRIPGWMQLHYRLAFDENGFAEMYVFNTCKAFIRTIPTLQYDKNRPEDLDTEGEDHVADETRYFLMSRPIKPKETGKRNTFNQGPLHLFLDIEQKDLMQDVGFIIERPEYIPYYSAKKNLEIIAAYRKVADDQRICTVLEMFGLDPSDKKAVGKYSLGMKQKLALSMAFLEDPKVLILDEPLSALDADSVQEARKRILEEKERGKLVLIASHYPEDIQSLCDEVYWMKNGHVLPSKENK